MDYANGKIYCIRNTIDDDIYIGSTCQPLSKRMEVHRMSLKGYKKHRKLYSKISEIGNDKFYIELVEEYQCENKEQLRKREGYYIREMGTLNHLIAGQTQKEYYDHNKEHILQYHKQHYESNKEKLLEQNREYREHNKDELNKKQRERRELNKELINENVRTRKYTCSCGSCIRISSKAKHEKSNKHQQWLASVVL